MSIVNLLTHIYGTGNRANFTGDVTKEKRKKNQMIYNNKSAIKIVTNLFDIIGNMDFLCET